MIGSNDGDFSPIYRLLFFQTKKYVREHCLKVEQTSVKAQKASRSKNVNTWKHFCRVGPAEIDDWSKCIEMIILWNINSILRLQVALSLSLDKLRRLHRMSNDILPGARRVRFVASLRRSSRAWTNTNILKWIRCSCGRMMWKWRYTYPASSRY